MVSERGRQISVELYKRLLMGEEIVLISIDSNMELQMLTRIGERKDSSDMPYLGTYGHGDFPVMEDILYQALIFTGERMAEDEVKARREKEELDKWRAKGRDFLARLLE